MGVVATGRETGAIRRAARQEVVRLDELARGAAPVLAGFEDLVRDLVEADVPARLVVGRPAYREDGLPLTLSIPVVHPVSGGWPSDWPAEDLATVDYAVRIRPVRGAVEIELDPGAPEDEWDRRDPEWSECYAMEGKPGKPVQAFLDLVRELAIRREVALQQRDAAPAP